MSLFQKTKVALAHRRITKAALAASNGKHRHLTETLLNQTKTLPDDLILRIDTYQRKHNAHYPELLIRLPWDWPYWEPSSEQIGFAEMMAKRMDWVERTTPLVTAALKEHGDSNQPYSHAAIAGIPDLIDSVYEFSEKYREPLDDPQAQGLFAALFFLLQSTGKTIPLKKNSFQLQFYADGWVTQQLLERPTEVRSILAEQKARAARTMDISRVLNWGSDIPDYVADYSDDIVSVLSDLQKNDPQTYKTAKEKVGHTPTSEPELREFLYFASRIRINSYLVIQRFIDGLRYYDAIPYYEDYSSAPHEVLRQCEALVTVAAGISAHPVENGVSILTERNTISDSRLVQLLLDDPERADRIVQTLKERKTADFEVLSVSGEGVMGNGEL